jgi:ribosomal protein S27AE
MTKSLKSFCPKCLEHHACQMITVTTRVTLYGVDMHVEAKRLQCGACGNVMPLKELEQENHNRIVETYQDLTGIDLRLNQSEFELDHYT